jgi:site-specific DNA recombinase
LRIVPEQLWCAVEQRFAFVNKTYGSTGRRGGLMNRDSSPYVFSGLLRCGVCGANFSIVSGAGRGHRSASYGCPNHSFRGTCANPRRVKSDVLESELLAKLQNDVLSDVAIDYCLEKLEGEIEKRESAIGAETQAMLQRKLELEFKLKNLRALVEDGMDSPTIRKGIVEYEQEISQMATKTLGTGKGSVRKRMTDLRKFVKESLGDIRSLLAGKHHDRAPGTRKTH